MTDLATRLAGLPDERLLSLHKRADEKGPVEAAQIEAHHLISIELLKRGLQHGHIDDPWASAVIIKDTVGVSSPDDIDAPEGMEKAWVETLKDGGNVSILLTVDGYVLKADAGRTWSNKILGRVEKRAIPEAITDLHINIENRQHAIDEYLYGPMNPEEPGDYWERLGEVWDVPAEEAFTTHCHNCAAFNITPEIRTAIADAIGEGGEEVVTSADLGYCELFQFKCAAARSCSAWLVGGPIGPSDEDEDEYMDEGSTAVLKHPGHGSEKVHGLWATGGGSSLSSEGKSLIRNNLSRGGQVQSYGESYRNGKEAKVFGQDHIDRKVSELVALRDPLISQHAGKPRTFESEGAAFAVASHQGFIDGALGHKAQFARSHNFSDMVAGLLGAGLSGATKSVDLLKHGEPDRAGYELLHPGGAGGIAGLGLKDPANPPGDPSKHSADSIAAAKAERARVAEQEPKITADMQKTAADNGAKMAGLEYRLKSEKSLARKISDEKADFGGDAAQTAAAMSDVARYTMTFKDESYVSGVNDVIADLRDQGYELRVKNYWQDGDPYQGLNIAAVHPSGVKFELQIHTPTSLDFKEPTHTHYDTYRESMDTKVRYKEYSTMRRIARGIPKPPPPDLLMAIGEQKYQPFTTAQGTVVPV